MKKNLCRCSALLLALLLLLSGCAAHGKTLMKAGKTDISVNVFSLYLSRMKGNLAYNGMDVTSDTFWSSYTSIDNTTYAQYYTSQVLQGLREIAAALILYEKEGLSLSKEDKEDIDAWIEQIVTDSGDGSENKVNSLLAAYGANLTTLRDAAEIEAKIAQLKLHLYGENGSLISSTAKEEFYQATYYRGYQMLIANYYYEHDVDTDGETIYYVKDKDGYASAKIAYDTEKGTETEETDINGDTVYRGEDGRIAYDAENGVPNYHYSDEEKKEPIKVNYTKEKMDKRLLAANEIAKNCKGDTAAFLQCIEDWSDNSDFTDQYAPNGMYFCTAASYGEVFRDFATELADLKEGDIVLLTTDEGYYLLQRAPLDSAAWQEEANETWFSTFTELIMEYMLQQRTAEYLTEVTVDEALAATVDITSVDPNYYY